MDRKRAQQAAIVAMAILAIVCSVAAQQQQQPQAPTPTPPKPVDCNATTTKPKPAQQSYVFGKCIVAKFGAYYLVPEGNVTKFVVLENGEVNLDESSCENSTPVLNPKLVVDFKCASIEFMFQKVDESIIVNTINGKFRVDGKDNVFANSTPMFKIDQGHYYKCNTEQTIPGGNGVKLVLSNVALEAFRNNTSGTDFYKMPEECPLDSAGASDFVRIGVGIALFLLAALVLVAYFVGRRRWAERSSYESV